jgi:hypothetical protein
MSIESSTRARVQALIDESHSLRRGDTNDQCTDAEQRASCKGWLAAAQNAVHHIVSQPDSPYRTATDRIAHRSHGYSIHHAVGEAALVLLNLLRDIDAGMIAALADQARAETFDDFLDHAVEYAKSQRKNESGVIAGVVFEDSLRRVCRKHGVPEKGVKLDALISELSSKGVLTAVKAKRARAAADVRTKATHAQWDEFELDDVRAAIALTRELIEAELT